MTTKISIEIHNHGSENEFLTRLIASVNSGASTVSIDEVRGYLKTRKAAWPTVSNYSYLQEGNKLHFSEDGGKTFTLSLEWKEIEESKTDDLIDINFTPGSSDTEREIINETDKH